MGNENAAGLLAFRSRANDGAVCEPTLRHELFLHAYGVRFVFHGLCLGVAHAKPCFTPSYFLPGPLGLKEMAILNRHSHNAKQSRRLIHILVTTPRKIDDQVLILLHLGSDSECFCNRV